MVGGEELRMIKPTRQKAGEVSKVRKSSSDI
jgi:hypothetical protein